MLIHVALCTFLVHFKLYCLIHFPLFFLVCPMGFFSVCVRAGLILSHAFSFLKFHSFAQHY